MAVKKEPVMQTAEEMAATIEAEAMQSAEEMAAAIEAEAMQSAKPEKRMVKLKLFKDNGRYKDPVYAAVNGESYLVPRGVEVEVPDYIAEVIENSIKQDEATVNQMEVLEDKFNEKTRAQK